MKTRLLLSFIVIVSLLATACSRKCCTPGPTNYMQAQKNTATWFRNEVSVTNTDSLTLVGRGNDDVLSIKIKYTAPGKYLLTGAQARYTIIVGGDVTGVEYIIDNTKENFVNVKYYDTAAGVLYGDFTLNLVKGPRYSAADNTYSVIAAFTNGTFQMQLAK